MMSQAPGPGGSFLVTQSVGCETQEGLGLIHGAWSKESREEEDHGGVLWAQKLRHGISWRGGDRGARPLCQRVQAEEAEGVEEGSVCSGHCRWVGWLRHDRSFSHHLLALSLLSLELPRRRDGSSEVPLLILVPPLRPGGGRCPVLRESIAVSVAPDSALRPCWMGPYELSTVAAGWHGRGGHGGLLVWDATRHSTVWPDLLFPLEQVRVRSACGLKNARKAVLWPRFSMGKTWTLLGGCWPRLMVECPQGPG